MKTERSNSGFKPVTITLETEEEVMLYGAILGRVQVPREHREAIHYTYKYLVDAADYGWTFESHVGVTDKSLRIIRVTACPECGRLKGHKMDCSQGEA